MADGGEGGERPLAPPQRRRATGGEGRGAARSSRAVGVMPCTPAPGLWPHGRGAGWRAGSRSQCQSLSRRSSQRRSWSSMKESQPRFSSRFGVFAWRAGPVPFGRDNA